MDVINCLEGVQIMSRHLMSTICAEHTPRDHGRKESDSIRIFVSRSSCFSSVDSQFRRLNRALEAFVFALEVDCLGSLHFFELTLYRRGSSSWVRLFEPRSKHDLKFGHLWQYLEDYHQQGFSGFKVVSFRAFETTTELGLLSRKFEPNRCRPKLEFLVSESDFEFASVSTYLVIFGSVLFVLVL